MFQKPNNKDNFSKHNIITYIINSVRTKHLLKANARNFPYLYVLHQVTTINIKIIELFLRSPYSYLQTVPLYLTLLSYIYTEIWSTPGAQISNISITCSGQHSNLLWYTEVYKFGIPRITLLMICMFCLISYRKFTE